jgi:RimJ/RimL family protein N-acetyltransferase
MRWDFGWWCIRGFKRRDVAALAKHANNPNVSHHLRDAFPYPYTRRDARIWVEAAMAQEVESHFAIATKDELIGGVGFHPQEDVHRRSAELGYWLGEAFWGRGIASQAVPVVVAHAFREFDLVRIFAYVFEGNAASERVLEKAGFVCEGVLRQSVFKQGRMLDQKLYALLREEWQQRQPPRR